MVYIISNLRSIFFLALVSGIMMLVPTPSVLASGKPIVLDAGHGGYDTGIVAPVGKEKDIALEIVRRLKASLEDMDRSVWLTRKIDQYSSLSERRREAVAAAPGMFLSLHFSESDTLVIYITWYLKADSNLSLEEYYSINSSQRRHLYKSKALSRALGRTLAEIFEVSVEYREMPIELLNVVGAPAVMLELPSSTIDYQERLPEVVAGIINGITKYEQ